MRFIPLIVLLASCSPDPLWVNIFYFCDDCFEKEEKHDR